MWTQLRQRAEPSPHFPDRGLLAAFEIRPRRATELVDASFQLLRRFYPQFVTVSAIAIAPSVLLRIVMRDRLGDPTKIMANVGVFGGSLLLSTFCIAIADAVLVIAASDGYLEGNVDLARAFGLGLNRIFSVIGSAIIRWAAVFLPIVLIGVVSAVLIPRMAKGQSSAGVAGLFALLLIPLLLWWTIHAGLRSFAMTSAVMLEGDGPISSLSRSWGLSKRCTAHIFFSLGLAWLLYFVMVMIVTVIGQLMLSVTIVGILTTILVIPIYPLLAIVSTLLYYDLRIRKEGFDLQMMSKDLGAAAPLPAA
jgi:hypothetical protein